MLSGLKFGLLNQNLRVPEESITAVDETPATTFLAFFSNPAGIVTLKWPRSLFSHWRSFCLLIEQTMLFELMSDLMSLDLWIPLNSLTS